MDHEHVVDLPIEVRGPKLKAVRTTDELHRHAQAPACASHAALEQMCDTECPADLGVIDGSIFVGKRRHWSSDSKAGNPRQAIDELDRQPLDEVQMLQVWRYVREWQHGNRWRPRLPSQLAPQLLVEDTFAAVEVRDQPISAPWNALDVFGLVRVVVQRPAQLSKGLNIDFE